MPSKYHGRGSIGTSMSLIRIVNGHEIKKKPPKRCNCKECVFAIIHGDCVDCYITGNVAVNERYCYYFKTEADVVNEKKGKQTKYALTPKKSKLRWKSKKKGGGHHGKRSVSVKNNKKNTNEKK